MNMDSTQLFDPAPLEELRNLDKDSAAGLVNSLIEMFASSAEKAVADMQAAIGAGKPKELANIAHTFKSSSGNIGAIEFSQTCEKLEKMAMYKVNDLQIEGHKLCRHLTTILPETLNLLNQQKN